MISIEGVLLWNKWINKRIKNINNFNPFILWFYKNNSLLVALYGLQTIGE